MFWTNLACFVNFCPFISRIAGAACDCGAPLDTMTLDMRLDACGNNCMTSIRDCTYICVGCLSQSIPNSSGKHVKCCICEPIYGIVGPLTQMISVALPFEVLFIRTGSFRCDQLSPNMLIYDSSVCSSLSNLNCMALMHLCETDMCCFI